MFIPCQANKFFAIKTLLSNQKPRAHFKPDFSNFVSIPSYSRLQALIKLGQDFLNPCIDAREAQIQSAVKGSGEVMAIVDAAGEFCGS